MDIFVDKETTSKITKILVAKIFNLFTSVTTIKPDLRGYPFYGFLVNCIVFVP